MQKCAYHRCHAPVIGPGLRVLGLNERALLFCTRACLLGHYAEVCREPAPWPSRYPDSVERHEFEDPSQPYKAVAHLSEHSGIPLTGMTATTDRVERAYAQAEARLNGLHAAASARLKAARMVALSDCPQPLASDEPLPDLAEVLAS